MTCHDMRFLLSHFISLPLIYFLPTLKTKKQTPSYPHHYTTSRDIPYNDSYSSPLGGSSSMSPSHFPHHQLLRQMSSASSMSGRSSSRSSSRASSVTRSSSRASSISRDDHAIRVSLFQLLQMRKTPVEILSSKQ